MLVFLHVSCSAVTLLHVSLRPFVATAVTVAPPPPPPPPWPPGSRLVEGCPRRPSIQQLVQKPHVCIRPQASSTARTSDTASLQKISVLPVKSISCPPPHTHWGHTAALSRLSLADIGPYCYSAVLFHRTRCSDSDEAAWNPAHFYEGPQTQRGPAGTPSVFTAMSSERCRLLRGSRNIPLLEVKLDVF